MTTTTIKLPISSRPDVAPISATSIWKVVQTWRARARQRRRLTELTTDQLEDVGITVEAARIEAAKPFWKK